MSMYPKAEVEIIKGQMEKENLAARTLAGFVMDLSGSMHSFLPLVRKNFDTLMTALSKKTVERLRIELSLCAFATDVIYHDYAPANYYLETQPIIETLGATSLGATLHVVMNHAEQRRTLLDSVGIHCEKSVCAIITDGQATDPEILMEAIPRVRAMQSTRALEFIPIAPSPDCYQDLFNIFGVEPIPETIDFSILFAAFSRSLSQWSQGGASGTNAVEVVKREIDSIVRRKELDSDDTPPLPRLLAE